MFKFVTKYVTIEYSEKQKHALYKSVNISIKVYINCGLYIYQKIENILYIYWKQMYIINAIINTFLLHFQLMLTLNNM